MALLILAFLGTFGLLASAGLLLFYRDAVRNDCPSRSDRIGPVRRRA